MKNLSPISLLVAACFISNAASAQNYLRPDDPFHRFTESKNKGFDQYMPGETIDHFSGTLRIVQEDLSLPGKGGLDLKIIRTYSSKIWSRTDLIEPGASLQGPSFGPVGFGWTLHFGRVLKPNASGQPSGCGGGQYPVYESPDGTARIFYPEGGRWVSRDFWLFQAGACGSPSLPGSGSCVTRPDGIRINFSANDKFYIQGDLLYPATSISDVQGNSVNITYEPFTTTSGGFPRQVTDTWGRVVDFEYARASPRDRLTRITASAGGPAFRTISYSYEFAMPQGGAGQVSLNNLSGPWPFLQTVSQATGKPFRYGYGHDRTVTQNQYALSSIEYPYGGRVDYDYETISTWAGYEAIGMAFIKSRIESGRGLPTAAYQYSYNAANGTSGELIATVTKPDTSIDEFTYHNFTNSTGNGSVWKIGLLKRAKRGISSNAVQGLEQEDNDWAIGARIAQVGYGAPQYSVASGNCVFDNAVFAPTLKARSIQRDGRRYNSDFSGFDAYGQPTLVQERGELGTNGATLANSTVRTRLLSYDYRTTTNEVLGRVLRDELCEAATCGAAVASVVSSRSYDATTGLIESETSKGVTTSYTYHPGTADIATVVLANGAVLGMSDYSFGVARTLSYAGLYTRRRTINPDGTTASETDPRNNTTTYSYDAAGRILTETPPAPAQSTKYEYDPVAESWFAKLRGTAVSNGFREVTRVDGLGRTVEVISGLAAATEGQVEPYLPGNTASVFSIRRTVFDTLGRTVFEQTPTTSTTQTPIGTRTEYDDLGRAVRVTSRGTYNNGVFGCLDCSIMTTSYAAGNCTETSLSRDAMLTQKTRKCFRAFGSPSSSQLVRSYDPRQMQAALTNTDSWTYAYDVAGNLTQFDGPLAAARRTNQYTAGQFFLRTSTSGPRGLSTVTQHGPTGLPLATTDARGIQKTIAHDALLRMQSMSYSGGTGDNESRTYVAHQLSTVGSSNGGGYAFTYDAQGRVASQTWTFGGSTFTTSYTRNPAGCITRIQYPTGTTVDFTCDAANRPITAIAGAQSLVSSTTYHATGKPAVISYANSTRWETTESGGRIAEIALPSTRLSYGYDKAGNIISITDSASPALTTSLEYDARDQLLRATVGVAPASVSVSRYEYDALGNRTFKSEGGVDTNYTYDSMTNRLKSMRRPVSATTQTYNLTWNSAERLSSSSDGASYKFDALGRRVRKEDPGNSVDVTYHYDPAGLLLSETRGSSRIRDYVYIGSQLVAVLGCPTAFQPPCNDVEWIHTDMLGSVRARTRANGTVIQQLTAMPWGDWSAWNGESRAYNGRIYDSGTRLLELAPI